MSLDYAQEKAYKVLQSLGSSEGTLRERIFAAVVPSFHSLVDEAERKTAGLHEELMAELVAVYELEMVSEGTIEGTLDSLDELELIHLAERMVSLCIEVMQQPGRNAWMLGAHRGEGSDDS